VSCLVCLQNEIVEISGRGWHWFLAHISMWQVPILEGALPLENPMYPLQSGFIKQNTILFYLKILKNHHWARSFSIWAILSPISQRGNCQSGKTIYHLKAQKCPLQFCQFIFEIRLGKLLEICKKQK
jgi:hypothetical protein